jgi:hypothetical protein
VASGIGLAGAALGAALLERAKLTDSARARRFAPAALTALVLMFAVWATAARLVRENLGDTPRWLSTAGLGVPWLHLRLDSYPKYYRYRPYTTAT